MVCHPILKDYEPSDTFCLLSGCNSGLQEVLIYVPGWVGPGWVISPFVGQDLQRVTLAGPRTLLGESTAGGTGFHTAGDLHFCLFLTKKNPKDKGYSQASDT